MTYYIYIILLYIEIWQALILLPVTSQDPSLRTARLLGQRGTWCNGHGSKCSNRGSFISSGETGETGETEPQEPNAVFTGQGQEEDGKNLSNVRDRSDSQICGWSGIYTDSILILYVYTMYILLFFMFRHFIIWFQMCSPYHYLPKNPRSSRPLFAWHCCPLISTTSDSNLAWLSHLQDTKTTLKLPVCVCHCPGNVVDRCSNLLTASRMIVCSLDLSHLEWGLSWQSARVQHMWTSKI